MMLIIICIVYAAKVVPLHVPLLVFHTVSICICVTLLLRAYAILSVYCPLAVCYAIELTMVLFVFR